MSLEITIEVASFSGCVESPFRFYSNHISFGHGLSQTFREIRFLFRRHTFDKNASAMSFVARISAFVEPSNINCINIPQMVFMPVLVLLLVVLVTASGPGDSYRPGLTSFDFPTMIASSRRGPAAGTPHGYVPEIPFQ